MSQSDKKMVEIILWVSVWILIWSISTSNVVFSMLYIETIIICIISEIIGNGIIQENVEEIVWWLIILCISGVETAINLSIVILI